jgi:hypothetical protein
MRPLFQIPPAATMSGERRLGDAPTLSAGYPDTASIVPVATRPSSRSLAGTRLAGQQLGQGDPQRAGDQPQFEDGDVALAGLDGADEDWSILVSRKCAN